MAVKRATKAKTTAKKTKAKKATVTRKAPVAKAKKAPAKKAAASSAISTPLTKTQILSEIADNLEMNRKQVSEVLESLANLIERSVKKRGAGSFTLPGLMKINVVRKPATKARKGINPFTGEETVFKAKPARNVVKIKPLKKLKEMVA